MEVQDGLTLPEWEMLCERANLADELAIALRKLIEMNERNAALVAKYEKILDG